MRTRPLYDVVSVLARFGVGAVFIAHGWQKIEAGITATGRSFDSLGVPLPTAAAVYSAFVELLGGTALIVGLGLPVAGALLFVDMAGAFLFVHAENGVFLVDDGNVKNGYELVLLLGLASLIFATGGGGRLTADRLIVTRRRQHRDPDDREDEATTFVDSLRDTDADTDLNPDLKSGLKPGLAKTPPKPELESKPSETADDEDVMVAGARKAARHQRKPRTGTAKDA